MHPETSNRRSAVLLSPIAKGDLIATTKLSRVQEGHLGIELDMAKVLDDVWVAQLAQHERLGQERRLLLRAVVCQHLHSYQLPQVPRLVHLCMSHPHGPMNF